MASENKKSDDKESVNSSSPEDSPRENLIQEKDEEGSDSGQSLNANEDIENKGCEQEGSNHNSDDSSGSDSENQNKLSQSAAEVLIAEESGSGSDNVDNESQSTRKIEMESDSDYENPSKMHEAVGNVLDVDKESDSDSEILDNKREKDEKLEIDSNSDSDHPIKISKSAEEFSVEVEKNGSDSENENSIQNVERERYSNSENLKRTCQTVEAVHIIDKESGSGSEYMEKRSISIEKLDLESVPGSENPNKTSLNAEDLVDKESGSDSETEDSIQPSMKVGVIKGSVPGSENIEKRRQSAGKVEMESDSDSDNPKKMSGIAVEDPVEKKSSLDSENLDKKSRTTEKKVSDSESESMNKISQTAAKVLGAEKDSDSEDSENPDEISQITENLQKGSDSDSENPNKTKQITKRTLTEEESGLDCESPITLSRTVEEFVAEEEDMDPVFGETEDPDKEATRESSTQSMDQDAAAQANSWPGKAAALKNFVKMKGAVAVSNVIRRLSGGKDGDGIPEVEDKSKNLDIMNSVEGPNMKGRIILYTRLGCLHCKEVRSYLYQKRLRFVEINVDIYPSRKLELEKKSGSSSVPRLYFNDFPVGGLTELKAMDESGKLDEKINDVINEEPSSAAPLPPIPGEDDVSGTGKVDELASVVRKLKESIALSDRFYKMRRFNNCFVGSEAVDFLSQDQCLGREEAIELGRKLANNHFFQHVLEENVFEDGNHLYRFLEHDPSVSTQCHNMTRGLIEFKPKPIIEIASRLRFLLFAIFEAYVSEDGRHVNYRSIEGSEEFQRYLRVIEELQRVDLTGLSREEKLAFFINLYNMMAIHAILTWGYPAGALDRRKYFGDFKYVVSGCPYSLSAIQNGILRANQRPPYSLIKPFGPRDKRFKVALPYSEPLVHFALVYGTRSGPALRCYSPANIDKELLEAARDFLRTGGVALDAEAKVVSVSKILRWYSVDFGKNEAEVIKHAANYLEPSKSQELLDLQANNQLKVTYQPYDWVLNS